MTTHIGTVNLQFDVEAWVSGLEAPPTEIHTHRNRIMFPVGTAFMLWERHPAANPLTQKKGLDARICLANKPQRRSQHE